jgi:hypothetical protein
MPWQPFNAFIGGDDQRNPRFLNTEYTQNLYYESALPGENARSGGSLISTPGLQAQPYLVLPENGFILGLATVSRLLPAQGVTTPTTFVVVGRTNGNGNPALYRFNNDLSLPTFIQYLPFAGRSTDLVRIIPGNQNLMVIDTSVPQVYGLWHDYTAATAGAVGPTGTACSRDRTSPVASTLRRAAGMRPSMGILWTATTSTRKPEAKTSSFRTISPLPSLTLSTSP